ncbi:hypothetical protein MED121_00795 [Marinomonas sp. MED121]|uniref:putative 4-hydroxy-4-methyl-2-oxoglutarate aldolase n=1 Tax=Marinomonas sp. MED121 TaxID=314277 RepID=UPI000068FA18|nr:putative 4-hydroxy-4-methyl-2-oxoglutarate aldolase [Marinomonas sp. MED121]EAQ64125.1 hypothetical protein MED121_00795 [Marinomonas sp. MED121]
MLDLLPDLTDQYPDHLLIADPIFNSYGKKNIFYGEVVSVKCFEDNSRVKELVATPGKGKVMVVDGGGSKRVALLGDMLAEQAASNGWEGIIIYGAVRDVATQSTIDLGVKALAATPLRSMRKGMGEVGENIAFAGLRIENGDYIYADLNGIALAKQPLALDFL